MRQECLRDNKRKEKKRNDMSRSNVEVKKKQTNTGEKDDRQTDRKRKMAF